MALTLTNEGDTPMPAGLGWHPYFPRTPRATITATVRAVWLTDNEMMPTALASPTVPADPSRGVAVGAVALDNCFVGWSCRAVLEWPESGASLAMTAGPPLDYLVIFTPPGRPFFCAEPVSHVTDAFNLAHAGRADTGQQVPRSGRDAAGDHHARRPSSPADARGGDGERPRTMLDVEMTRWT